MFLKNVVVCVRHLLHVVPGPVQDVTAPKLLEVHMLQIEAPSHAHSKDWNSSGSQGEVHASLPPRTFGNSQEQPETQELS